MFSNSNSNVLYPGSHLQSFSVMDGTFVPSRLTPAPVTLTVNLQSLEGPISQTIATPSYTSVQTAVHDILSQNNKGDAGAEMSWSIDNVDSKEHLKAKLGMDFKVADIFGASGSLGMNFSSNTRKAVIHFNQKYYDVTIDPPIQPTALIDKSLTLEEIKTGGEYSKDSPGKPISYNLRYLSNNKPLKIVKSTDYTVRDCVRIKENRSFPARNRSLYIPFRSCRASACAWI